VESLAEDFSNVPPYLDRSSGCPLQRVFTTPKCRLHGQVTADMRGGAARRWDSFRVGDDTPGTQCEDRTALAPVALIRTSARLHDVLRRRWNRTARASNVAVYEDCRIARSINRKSSTPNLCGKTRPKNRAKDGRSFNSSGTPVGPFSAASRRSPQLCGVFGIL